MITKKVGFTVFTAVLFLFCGGVSTLSGKDIYLIDDSLSSEEHIVTDGSELPTFIDDIEIIESADVRREYSVQRFRKIEISGTLMKYGKIDKGDTVFLNLFNNLEYKGMVDRINLNMNGTFSVRVRIEEYPLGYMIISTTGNRSLATIRIPENKEFLMIKSDPVTLQHYLLDIGDDNIRLLESGPPLIPPDNVPGPRRNDFEERWNNNQKRNPGPDDPAVIDVMIVYTPQAEDWADENGGGIDNVVAQTMELSQLSHDNSRTILTLNLVLSSLIDYEGSGSGVTDLNRLTFSENWDPWGREDGPPWYMDEVHDWRDEHGADMVAMLSVVSDVGGVAWQLSRVQGYPELAFSLTRVQQAAATYTFAHELGHNMGAHHHRAQNFQPGPGLFNYSAGWRWTGDDDEHYCSVMTYSSGQYFDDGINHRRTSFFSNPDIEHQGVPTGHPVFADNARTIRETKHVIAAYRERIAIVDEFPWAEIFDEEDFPPQGWQSVTVTGEAEWERNSGGHDNNPAGAAEGDFNALYYGGEERNDSGYLMTPAFDLSGKVNRQFSFHHAQAARDNNQDVLNVYYSHSRFGDWIRIAHYEDNVPGWTNRTIILPDTLDTIFIKFEAVTDNGYGVVIDNIRMTCDPAEEYPLTASNPHPANDTINVSLELTTLSWDYIADTTHVAPAGFRVYCNTTGEFDDDDDYGWVPYRADRVRYSHADILPALQLGRRYYWQVIPTTSQEGGNDALNCPVWSFWTQGPLVQVTGQVTGNDAPDGLSGAVVYLSNISDTFRVETGDDGSFTIDDVQGSQDGLPYILDISYRGYQTHVSLINVMNEQTDLGVIRLDEESWLPRHLTAINNEEDNVVELIWDRPLPEIEPEEWLHWDRGSNHTAVGTGGAVQFIVAARFTPEQLEEAEVTGMHITAIRFFPRFDAAVYTLKVYRGGSEEPLHPGEEIRSQVVSDVVSREWNQVFLTNPVEILPEGELWFGYQIDTTGGHPAGCDRGPANDNYGNVMYWGGRWSTLLALNENMNYNWNIQAGLANIEEERSERSFTDRRFFSAGRDIDENKTYSVLTGDHPLPEEAPFLFEERHRVIRGRNAGRHNSEQNKRVLEGYRVYRFEMQDENNYEEWSFLAAVEDTAYIDTLWVEQGIGRYCYAVQAVYTESVYSGFIFSNTLSKEFQGGDGTAENPWRISNAEELNRVRNYLGAQHNDKHFIQVADIDFAGTGWQEGNGWIPIGSSAVQFMGHYDGDGFAVSNLFVERIELNNVGLFGYCRNATIKNITLIDADITGGRWVGGIVGDLTGTENNPGKVINCRSSGVISGLDRVGGLVGYTSRSIVENSYSNADVIALDSGEIGAGGLIGFLNNNSTAANSFATGRVSAVNNGSAIAGLIGMVSDSKVINCYAVGMVEDRRDSGGLIGSNDETEVVNSYWNIQTTGQEESDGGDGRNSAEMTYPYHEETYIEWDFEDIWMADVNATINNGYPFLLNLFSTSPTHASNPVPPTDSLSVSVNLEELRWSYIVDPTYTNPAGFRVYFNDTPHFEEDNFLWVPYIENQIEYACSEILPEQLDYFRYYYWKVIPTTIEPDERRTDGRLRRQNGTNRTERLSLHFRGDAENVPVWSFRTGQYPLPVTAINPFPADDTVGVSVILDSLRWSYFDDPAHISPIGFRVYFNDTGDFEEDSFVWIPYQAEQTKYAVKEILPTELEYNTDYFWQVVPTTVEPDNRAGGREQRAESVGQRAESREHRAEGRGQRAESGEQRAESRERRQTVKSSNPQSVILRGDAEDVPVWSFRTEVDTSVEKLPEFITELRRNYPNPFNPETVISFSLKKDMYVELTIYNIKGQLVKELLKEEKAAGKHSLIWNGTDNRGYQVGSGIYFYRMKTESYNEVNKMLLIK